MGEKKRKNKFRVPLIGYDILVYAIIAFLLLYVYHGAGRLSLKEFILQSLIGFVCVFAVRIGFRIYKQIWRYGGVQGYVRLLICDAVSFFLFLILVHILPGNRIAFAKLLGLCCMDTLAVLAMRIIYRYAYKCGNMDNFNGRVLRLMLRVFSFGSVETEPDPNSQKIKIAIVGAGSVGVTLAEELLSNTKSQYVARCFIDIDPQKAGRNIHGIDVLQESEATLEELKRHHIQEVVFTVPDMSREKKLKLYDYYQKAGLKIKIYDYPALNTPGAKRQLREFEISDLLFRAEKKLIGDQTRNYYKGKKILITGGGGSIGSELCRQLAKMEPAQLIVLDMYENTCYDLQQDLKFAYKGKVDIRIEICSIRDKLALSRVFAEYHPDICINAAAHKHVPLMEKNCIEAVENNVFGCLNVIQCCEEYGCGRFMMVSTDKAVNPTNIMGATKRACEMIMQAYSTRGRVKCSATRFGNVLGSAGSVIPIFKRQIAAGGPVTVTDRRIIRYFMTIPEASQLVLTSGAMSENGDIFVLDMGSPVKIWDLAENMIHMSGAQGIEIVETGLRPGEKLYEELLVSRDNLEKTDNDLIFIEHEVPVTMDELTEKLHLLRQACDRNSDGEIRKTMRIVVPTYRSPEEVNRKVKA